MPHASLPRLSGIWELKSARKPEGSMDTGNGASVSLSEWRPANFSPLETWGFCSRE